MGAIRQWALSIVVFLIFQGMMEILIPKGSIKKFIQLILGIAFLMIAVGPVLQFFRQDLQQDVFAARFSRVDGNSRGGPGGIWKNAAGDSGKTICGYPSKTVFRRAGPGGKGAR